MAGSSAGGNRLGPSLDSMIDPVLSHASAGRRLALVWLDVKDPHYCGEQENRGCSVAGLRDKAQRLTSAGIQVLYGFYEYCGCTALLVTVPYTRRFRARAGSRGRGRGWESGSVGCFSVRERWP